MTTRYEDGTYLRDNPGWHEEDSPWKAAQIARMLRRHGLRPRSVCEAGCGAGEVLRALAGELDPGAELVGYEPSPQAYALCAPKARPGLRFVNGEPGAEPDARFDLVLAIDVLEHVDDYLGFLRALRGRGAHTIFHVPLDLSVQTVLRARPILEGRRRVGHLHYFTKETALETLRYAGFEIEDHVYTRGSLELPARFPASLLRWPRRIGLALHEDLAVRVLGGCSLLVLAR